MGAQFTSLVLAAASVAALATASPGFAQTPAAPAAPPPAKTLQLPSISFSMGTIAGGNGPRTTATGRYTLDRHLMVEGSYARWTSHQNYFYPGYSYVSSGTPVYTGDWSYDDERTGWSAGAALLFQTTYKRLSWFSGGGIEYAAERYRTAGSLEGCVAPAGSTYFCARDYEYSDERHGLVLQATTGADFRIAGPLMAYGAIHFTGGPNGPFAASAGVRVVARSVDVNRMDRARVERFERSGRPRVPASSAIGKAVRVTLQDGTQRKGTLISLTEADVVIHAVDGLIDRRYSDARYQTANVRLIETTHRKAAKGLLWGLVAGAVLGVVSSLDCGDEIGYCTVVFAPLFAGAGAGIGAAIGGLADRLSAPSHVIYAGPNRSAQLIPITTRKGGGIGVRLRW